LEANEVARGSPPMDRQDVDHSLGYTLYRLGLPLPNRRKPVDVRGRLTKGRFPNYFSCGGLVTWPVLSAIIGAHRNTVGPRSWSGPTIRVAPEGAACLPARFARQGRLS
jgi:hypothetical protein